MECSNVGSFVLPLVPFDVENRLMQPNPLAFQVLLAAPAAALLFPSYRSSYQLRYPQDVLLSPHHDHPRVPALSTPRALPWKTPCHVDPIRQRFLQLFEKRTLPFTKLSGNLQPEQCRPSLPQIPKRVRNSLFGHGWTSRTPNFVGSLPAC